MNRSTRLSFPAILLTLTATFATPSSAATLVASYALDEGAGTVTADNSGSGYTGTLTNGPTWVAGKYGNALSFNATDDGNDSNDPKVVLGRTINIPNLPFTVSAWVNPASFADWRAIISKRDTPSASNMRFDMGLAANSGRVYVSTGSNFRSFLYSAPLNAWTHLAVVVEAGSTKLYVNGVLRETLGAITLGTGNNANMAIGGTGAGPAGDNDPFKGLLDDLRLYSGAQTQAEIQTDMNTPAGVPDAEPPVVSMTAPAAGTVTGAAVTVSANASDNIVVAGVQFKLDGVDLGAEDTTAPYSIVWNSTLTLEGSHTLTAVARDAGGNSTTSEGVIVTVSNPPTLTITQPANGATIIGTSVPVSYVVAGNLSEVSHVHFQRDTNPIVMDITMDGSYQFNNVPAGSHVLNGFLVRADHSKIVGTDAAPVSFTTAAPDTTPANSLVAAYALDEGSGTITADVSGGGNPGTLTNAPVWSTGKYGTAISFNATDDGNDSNDPKVVLGRTLNIPDLPFTFSAWVNPASFADWRAIISKRDSPSSSNMRFDMGLAATSGRVYVSTGFNFRSFLYSPPLNAWTHLAVVAEAGGTKLYVNGVLRETIGAITLGTGINANMAIGGTGAAPGGDNDPFKGLLDDLRLYNRAQTQAEIETDMNTQAGNPTAQPPTLTITQPANGSTIVGTTVDVSYVAAGDLTSVDHVHFTLDNDPMVMDITFDGSYQFTNVPAGPHVLNAFLVDVNHNLVPGSNATPIAFTTTVADTEPPTVSITSPAAGSTLTGTVAITVNAADNTGILGVQYRVDAVNLVPESTSPPFSTSLNTTNFANGTYVLTAVARDAAGNTTVSNGVSVTLSNINPNDPAQVGLWSAVTPWPNVAVHMTIMSDGNILTWDDHTYDGGSHVYNPTTNTFTPTPYNPANLFCSGHTALADGRILVNGGHVAAYVGITETVLFTPSTRTWATVAPMAYARWYPTTITLPDARVLTVSGAINCPDCKFPGDPDAGVAEIPEIYDPVTNSWSQLTGAVKNLPIYPHLFVLPDGRVIATSTQEDPISSVVLDMNTRTWSTVDPRVIDGGSSVMYLPGKFMMSGAAINADYPALPANALAHVLDMTTPPSTWRQIASMAFPRTQHNLTLLPDGSVLATGGARNSNVFDQSSAVFEAELWSPTTETWTTLAANQTPRMYHSTAVLLPDGRVLSAGGGRFGPNQMSGEFYSPPYLFKGPRPTITAAPSLIDYNTSFTVTTPDAGRIAKVSLIRFGSVTHAINTEQRFLPLTFQQGSGSLTIDTPANANLAPPGYYMLFIVDTNGVPSVAATVRFPAPTEDYVAPTAPTNLAATGSVGSTSLTWTASTDAIGVVAYDIHRSATAGFTPSTGNKVGVTALTSYIDAGLAAGTYFYKVQARDAAGNTSQPSNEATAAVAADVDPPTIPLGLTAAAMSSSRIDLSWSISSDNVRVAGYRVYRGAAEIATTTLPVYSDNNLNEQTTYSYTVAAVDDAGNASLPSDPASATTLASNSPANFLVAAYSLDEGSGTTTADLSNGNNDGTLTNGPTWVAGKYGNALSFNASDDGNDSNDPKVVLGRNLNVPDLPFTFSAWVNPASFADWRAIFSKRDSPSASNMRFDVGLAATSGRVYVSTGSNFRSFLYGPPLNTWTHLAVVAEAGGTKLYVNGVLRETVGAITLGTGVNANVAIGGTGAGAGGDNDPYKGLLDDLRLYSRALTQAEITTDMNTPTGNPGPQPPTLAITQPANGSTVSGTTVNVSYTTAGDLAEVAYVHFMLDESPMVMDMTVDGSYQFTNVTPGAHTLDGFLVRADHTKISGTDAPTVAFTTTLPDTVPPTVSITAPAAGSTLSAAATITADAGDNTAVLGVQFRIGAVDLTPEDTTAPYAVSFNTATFPNGTYILTAVARDAAGNTTVSAGVSVTLTNTVVLASGYAFDEGSGTTTADLSGNGFTGTLTNGPTWVAGKYGNALSFNASDDGNDSNDPKVVLGRTINIPNLPFTFSAWVNPASFADWRAIISKRDSPTASNMRFDMGLAANSGRVYLSTGSSFRSFLYSPPLNAWTHLAVVAEPGASKLYVNGVLRETLGAITLGTGNNANMAIGGTGAGPGGDNDPYKGLLDDLRLYNRALTQIEIQNDMNTQLGAPPPAATPGEPLASTAAAIETSPPAPAVLRIFPNPFRGSTRIEARGSDEVAVYDVTGRRVRTWRSFAAPSALGVFSVEWNGSDRSGRRLPAGIYFVKSGRQIARVALLR